MMIRIHNVVTLYTFNLILECTSLSEGKCHVFFLINLYDCMYKSSVYVYLKKLKKKSKRGCFALYN